MGIDISKITESNVLALWLGNIGDFGDLDGYIWDSFESDFGLKFGESTGPEADAHESVVPVEELLDGFSFSDSWKDDAVKTCNQAGWSGAHCAVVLYNVRYPAELAKARSASLPLTFVANINWSATKDDDPVNGVGRSPAQPSK